MPRAMPSRRALRLATLLSCAPLASAGRAPPPPVTRADAAALREEVREMVRPLRFCAPSPRASSPERRREQFTFSYDNYMRHAFPRDELRPLSCGGAVRASPRRRPASGRHSPRAPPPRTRWGGTRSLWWTR